MESSSTFLLIVVMVHVLLCLERCKGGYYVVATASAQTDVSGLEDKEIRADHLLVDLVKEEQERKDRVILLEQEQDLHLYKKGVLNERQQDRSSSTKITSTDTPVAATTFDGKEQKQRPRMLLGDGFYTHIDQSDEFSSLGRYTVGGIFVLFIMLLWYLQCSCHGERSIIVTLGRSGLSLCFTLVMVLCRYVLSSTGNGPSLDIRRSVMVEPALFMLGIQLLLVGLGDDRDDIMSRLTRVLQGGGRYNQLMKILFVSAIISALLTNEASATLLTPVLVQMATDTTDNDVTATTMDFMVLVAGSNLGSTLTYTGNLHNLVLVTGMYDDMGWLEFTSNMVIPVILSTLVHVVLIALFSIVRCGFVGVGGGRSGQGFSVRGRNSATPDVGSGRDCAVHQGGLIYTAVPAGSYAGQVEKGGGEALRGTEAAIVQEGSSPPICRLPPPCRSQETIHERQRQRGFSSCFQWGCIIAMVLLFALGCNVVMSSILSGTAMMLMAVVSRRQQYFQASSLKEGQTELATIGSSPTLRRNLEEEIDYEPPFRAEWCDTRDKSTRQQRHKASSPIRWTVTAREESANDENDVLSFLKRINFEPMLFFIGQSILTESLNDTGLPMKFFMMALGSQCSSDAVQFCTFRFASVIAVLVNILSPVSSSLMLLATWPYNAPYIWCVVSFVSSISGSWTALGSSSTGFVLAEAKKRREDADNEISRATEDDDNSTFVFNWKLHACYQVTSAILCLYIGLKVLPMFHFAPECSERLGECYGGGDGNQDGWNGGADDDE